ncbi:MAG: hypothetical protein IPP51_05900 [Bacteroidetes bacterium]|nr:hypothetical protein [Bacteroidota bacterium]
MSLSTSGGTAPYSYNSQAVTNLLAGTYTYTVTDANGCSATTVAVIDPQPDVLTLSATPNQIQCYGGRGSVTLNGVGGTAPYYYSGSASTNLVAGTYSYTVTDSHSCTATASAVITPQPTRMLATVATTTSACTTNTGTATVNTTGGTTFYILVEF